MIIFREIPLDDGELACVHCCTVSAPTLRAADDVRAEIEDVVESWACGLGPNIAFTGCDPLAHPDLEEFARTAVARGVQRIRVDLGEGRLETSEQATGLVDAGVRNLRVTLFGHAEESHDLKTGSRGHYDSTAGSIERFKAAAAAVGVHVAVGGLVPLCAHNVTELPAVVAKFAEFGATRCLVKLVDGSVDLNGVGPWVVAAFDTGTVNRIWVEAEGVPFFVAPGHEIHMSNTVREFPGVKAEICADCEAGPWCNGITPEASPEMLADLVRRSDHADLADRLRRAREGVAP